MPESVTSPKITPRNLASASFLWILLVTLALFGTTQAGAEQSALGKDTGSIESAPMPDLQSIWYDRQRTDGPRSPRAATVRQTEVVPSGGPVDQMQYSSPYGLLFVREVDEIRIVEVTAEQVIGTRQTLHPAEPIFGSPQGFSDLSVTPDGRFLFALEWRFQDSIVHRFDAQDRSWDTQTVPAGEYGSPFSAEIEAVNGTEILILHQYMEAFDLSYASYSAGSTSGIVVHDQVAGGYGLAPINGGDNLFGASITFDSAAQDLVYLVESPNARPDILQIQVKDEALTVLQRVEVQTPATGRALMNGGFEVIFLNNVMVDAVDPTIEYRRFPDDIIAASALWGFSAPGDVYYLPTGESIGSVGFTPSAVHATPGSGDIFLAQPDNQTILHCTALGPYIGCPFPFECAGEAATVVIEFGEQPTEGDDVIWGTNADEVINARGGNDIVCGRGGNDILIGGGGNDRLYGNAGNDSLAGNAGADLLVGGPGNDTHLGGAGDDRLYGVTGADILRGQDGDDILWGFAGDDRMFGGNGDDFFAGHSGNDIMNGDAGNDRMFGGTGTDTINGGTDDDVLSGGSQNDTLAGGPGDDQLMGNSGLDTLGGQGGNDTLLGGSENDQLFGGDGSDTCNGGAGMDTADIACEDTVSVP